MDFFRVTRFLTTKLVAGKSTHDKPISFEFSVQCFEPFILSGESTLLGNINNKPSNVVNLPSSVDIS